MALLSDLFLQVKPSIPGVHSSWKRLKSVSNPLFGAVFFSKWACSYPLSGQKGPKCSVEEDSSEPMFCPLLINCLLPRLSVRSISPEAGQEPYKLKRGKSQIAVNKQYVW